MPIGEYLKALINNISTVNNLMRLFNLLCLNKFTRINNNSGVVDIKQKSAY
jgi:hypothetical protein